MRGLPGAVLPPASVEARVLTIEATKIARQLDYEIETMWIRVFDVVRGEFTLHFMPTEPGIQGGDLTVVFAPMDRSVSCAECDRPKRIRGASSRSARHTLLRVAGLVLQVIGFGGCQLIGFILDVHYPNIPRIELARLTDDQVLYARPDDARGSDFPIIPVPDASASLGTLTEANGALNFRYPDGREVQVWRARDYGGKPYKVTFDPGHVKLRVFSRFHLFRSHHVVDILDIRAHRTSRYEIPP